MVYFFSRADEFLQAEIHPPWPRRHLVAAGCATHRDVPALLAEVQHLREENAALRNAALTFGALAERLNERAVCSRGDRR